MDVIIHFDDFSSSEYTEIAEIGELGNFTVLIVEDGVNSHYINTSKIVSMDIFEGEENATQ